MVLAIHATIAITSAKVVKVPQPQNVSPVATTPIFRMERVPATMKTVIRNASQEHVRHARKTQTGMKTTSSVTLLVDPDSMPVILNVDHVIPCV